MNTSCKLCGKPGALVKCSHVIPKWMYIYAQRQWMDTHGPMRILSSHVNEHEQRSPTGIYGKFVCAGCEDKFQKWDDYAAKILRGNSTLKTIETPSGLIRVHDFGHYDYIELKLFYLSILWRAHACDHQFFDQFDLGKHTDNIATCLLTKDKSLIDSFDIWATYSSYLMGVGVLEPRFVILKNVGYCQLYMPHYQALIKMDDKHSDESLKHMMLTQGEPLYMVEKSFDEFGEIEHFYNIASENMRKKSDLSSKNT